MIFLDTARFCDTLGGVILREREEIPMLQSFLTVGQQIITLYLLLVVGFVLGKVKILDDRASTAMSNLVMYVVSPCIMIVAFQRPLEREMLRNFGLVTGVSLLLHVVFIVVAVLLIRDGATQRQGDLRFAAVFSNCGFIGYPLMAAMLGSIGIFYGSAYVIVFTVLTWTWGVYAVTGDRSQLRLKPLLLNPGVISVVAAMALYLLSVRLPELVVTPLNYLANMNTPLPMIVVGYQLSHANFRQAFSDRCSWGALGLRLVVIPLAAIALCYMLRVDSAFALVTVIAASTPPAALMSMFAQKFGADTKLASSVVSVFTAISVLTIPPMVGLAQYLMG